MKHPQKQKSKLTDAERHKRFVETAKKVDASDKSEDFDKAFNSLDVRIKKGPKNDASS
jgi:hypothetical protein